MPIVGGSLSASPSPRFYTTALSVLKRHQKRNIISKGIERAAGEGMTCVLKPVHGKLVVFWGTP